MTGAACRKQSPAGWEPRGSASRTTSSSRKYVPGPNYLPANWVCVPHSKLDSQMMAQKVKQVEGKMLGRYSSSNGCSAKTLQLHSRALLRSFWRHPIHKEAFMVASRDRCATLFTPLLPRNAVRQQSAFNGRTPHHLRVGSHPIV